MSIFSRKKDKPASAPRTQKEREEREATRADRAEARRDPNSRRNIAMPYIFVALAVFSGLCLYTHGCGFFGDIVRFVSLSFFSYAAYAFPLFLFLCGLTWRRALRQRVLGRRILFFMIALLLLLALVHVVTLPTEVLSGTIPRGEVPLEGGSYFNYDAPHAVRGGFLGALIGWVLFRLVGPVMTIVLAALAVLLYGIFGFGFSPDTIVMGFIRYCRNRKGARVTDTEPTAAEPAPAAESLPADEAAPTDTLAEAPAEEAVAAEVPTVAEPAPVPPADRPERRTFAEVFAATGGTREGTPPPAAGSLPTSEEELRAYRAQAMRERLRADEGVHTYVAADLAPTLTPREAPAAPPAEEPEARPEGTVTHMSADVLSRAAELADTAPTARTVEDFRRITVTEPTRVYTPHTPPTPTVAEEPAALEETTPTVTVTAAQAPVEAPAPAPAPTPAPVPAKVEPAPAPATVEQPAPAPQAAAVEIPLAPIGPATVPTPAPAETMEAVAPAAPKAVPAPEKKPYELPPTSLLILPESDPEANQEEIQRTADTLVKTFKDFGIPITITGYSRGSRITRYEFVQQAGIRVSKVASYVDDITQKLSTQGVRIEAPIPNRSSIGVEVPNRNPTIVRIRSLIDTDTFRTAESKTTMAVGTDVTGCPIFFDIAKAPHMLIAGATGMGKSVCINTILLSLLYKATPDDVRLILIDPKKVEFSIYSRVPHLLVPVVTDPNKAAGALNWAVNEMEKRYDLIQTVGVRDIKGYNSYCQREGIPPLPKIVIIIDELNDLMMSARKIVEASICRIAQKARAAGIHLIIGTQRPSVNVITGDIKVNIPARISFRVNRYEDSKTIIDMGGAEKLLPHGDMLFSPTGTPQRVQGAFVDDEEVGAVVSHLADTFGTAIFDDEVLAGIEREAAKCAQKTGGGDDDDEDYSAADGIYEDPQFEAALDIVFAAGSVSTSMLQRKLGVGFGKAARYIDAMHEMGIVGESPGGARPREVLISRAEYEDRKTRLDD